MTQKDQEYASLAIACLWRVVELSTSRHQSVQCHTALGAAYRSLKDALSLQRAAAQHELVLHYVPNHLPAMTGLAAVLRDQDELTQAKALYERILTRAPQDQHALNGLAGVLYDLGDQQAAQLHFQQGAKPQFVHRQQ